MVNVRKEEPEDATAITRINAEAFAGPGEARLIESLRQNEKILFSFVAILEEQLVGHILFSPMNIITAVGKTHLAVGLGPVAVLPDYQGQGIGSDLCRTGLAMCRDSGHELVLVLGHPTYYQRFGFRPSSLFNISCAYDVPADAFMVLELQEGALNRVSGVAHYHPEFDAV